MQDSFPLFIGYPHIETWLRSVIPSNPVYMAVTVTPVSSTMLGVETHQVAIFIGQPEPGQSLVHYFRLLVGEMKYISGQCVTPGVMKQGQAAYDALEAHFETLLLVVVNGVIATPAGMYFQNGDASNILEKKTPAQ